MAVHPQPEAKGALPLHLKYEQLDLGRHRFRVRAIDPSGNGDPTPARDRFKRGRGER